MFLEHMESYRGELERVQEYQTIFSSHHGKRVLWDLAKYCHFFASSVSDSDRMTYVNEGRRDVFLRLLAILESSPERIKGLMDEHEEDQE